MKKYFQFGAGLALLLIILLSGCKSDPPVDPCNNTGQLCIENKSDSSVVVSITQTHKQITLQKDYMECFDLEANQVYTLSVSGPGFSMPDTTMLILPCDNKLMVLQK